MLRTRNSAAYKGIHALLLRDGGLDFLSGVPVEEQMYGVEQIDIHHVFPRGWCEPKHIDKSRTIASLTRRHFRDVPTRSSAAKRPASTW